VGKNTTLASVLERAKTLWEWRWTLRKKPGNVAVEAQQAIAALESKDAGFVHSFRSLLRPLVTICDHSPSDAPAQLRLKQLRKDIQAVADDHPDSVGFWGS
jgi:hypothetical protein